MKILLDECVDWRLIRDLPGHDAKSVKQLGWSEIKNGALLSLAARQFDAFITVDQKLPDEQEIGRLDLAVIVLRGRTTRLADLRVLLPRLAEALTHAEPGSVQVIDWRHPRSHAENP